MPTSKSKPLHNYVAIYNSKKWECKAESMYQAQCKAIEHFKVPKSKQGLLALVLADTPINTSTL